ncbi:hypothetical protein ACVWYG_001909 [Pedobacter sp. UYEF25]
MNFEDINSTANADMISKGVLRNGTEGDRLVLDEVKYNDYRQNAQFQHFLNNHLVWKEINEEDIFYGIIVFVYWVYLMCAKRIKMSV